MASAALSTRLAKARLMASESAMTFGRSGARSFCTVMPSRRPSNMFSALSTMELMLAGLGCEAGKRARVENSSTSVRTVSTEEAMVSAQWRITSSDAASGRVPRSRWRRMRSADNAIGVKRILDLVRDPAGYFAPGRLLLRLQQIRQIFKDQNVAQALFLDAAGWPR